MPLELNNATYKSFTDFASKVGGRTIASIDDKNTIKNEGSLGGRTIAPSKNWDFIGNIGRSASKQEANNAVRELFRQSIIDMFGGESMVPESVKTAMKLEDYGKGKPLSARRIMIVKAAIDNVKADMQPIKIDDAMARKLIDQSETFLGYSINNEEVIDQASQMLVKYGDGLPAKTARTLSNFIVNTLLNQNEGIGIEFKEDVIKSVAEDMKTWDDFSFGDQRLDEVGKEFAKRQNNYIKEKINDKTQFSAANPDIFNAMELDCNRFNWTINGNKYELGTEKQKVIDGFCDAVKDSKARKAISTIFNQGIQSDLMLFFYKTIDPDVETNLCQLPNANLFVSHDFSKGGNPITRTADGMYDLKVSDDGKTATITVTSMQDLTICNAPDDNYKIGKACITMQSTIDLTKEIPEVTNVSFAPTFSPDEIFKSA